MPDDVVVDVVPDVRFGAVYVVEDDGTRTQQGRDGRVEQELHRRRAPPAVGWSSTSRPSRSERWWCDRVDR